MGGQAVFIDTNFLFIQISHKEERLKEPLCVSWAPASCAPAQQLMSCLVFFFFFFFNWPLMGSLQFKSQFLVYEKCYDSTARSTLDAKIVEGLKKIIVLYFFALFADACSRSCGAGSSSLGGPMFATTASEFQLSSSSPCLFSSW